MATKLNTVAGANFTTAIGGAPSSGDSIYLKEGSDTYTSGISLPAVDALLLALMPEWYGNLGDATSYLDIEINRTATGKLVAAWSGQFAHVRGGTGGVISTVEMKPTRGGTLVLAGADIANIIQTSGVLLLKETADAESLRVRGGKAVLEYSAETGTLAEVATGGLIEIHRVMATVRALGGGRVIFGRDDKPPSTALEVLGQDAYVKYLGGTIPLLTGRAGTLDLRSATQPITITNAELHEGFKILFPLGNATVTWTNAPTIYGNDPRLPY